MEIPIQGRFYIESLKQGPGCYLLFTSEYFDELEGKKVTNNGVLPFFSHNK